MKEFIRKHEDRIHGVLSCLDRMLSLGYLPTMSGWEMAQFLDGLDVNGSSLKPYIARKKTLLVFLSPTDPSASRVIVARVSGDPACPAMRGQPTLVGYGYSCSP